MDGYAILAVPPEASAEEIRKAFYKAALRLHPDKNAGQTSAEFALAREAFEVLSDPVTRAQHDRQLGIASEQQNVDMQLRKEQFENEQKYFASKLAQNVSIPSKVSLTKEQLVQEAEMQKAALAELRKDDPSFRTLTTGLLFPSVKEARHYVDTHPGTFLKRSLQADEYSAQLEEETINRLQTVLNSRLPMN